MDGIVNLLSNFDGRIRRRTFWFGILLLFVMAIILVIIFSAIGLKIETGIGSLLVTLVLLYPVCAIYAKRLHDRNKPTMPWLAIIIVPGMLMALAQALGIGFEMIEMKPGEVAMMPTGGIGWLLIAIAAVVGLWALVELGFLSGTKGANDYGPDPVNRD